MYNNVYDYILQQYNIVVFPFSMSKSLGKFRTRFWLINKFCIKLHAKITSEETGSHARFNIHVFDLFRFPYKYARVNSIKLDAIYNT